MIFALFSFFLQFQSTHLLSLKNDKEKQQRILSDYPYQVQLWEKELQPKNTQKKR